MIEPKAITRQKRVKRIPFRKQLLVFILLLAVSAQLSSCYHYRVVASNDPATDYYTDKCVRHDFLWGAIQAPVAKADDCLTGGMAEVKVSTNFGYALATVLTLGIWSPMHIEWRCAKEQQPTDEGF